MAFLTRNLGSDASFHPLFRLLDDYDSYSRGAQGGRSGKAHLPSFQPKFDVRELEDAYELHGELAGMKKEDVHIEFSDPNTLNVRGRVERSYASGTPPAGTIAGAKSGGAITQSGEEAKEAQDSHKATVEDEATGADTADATPANAIAQSNQGGKKTNSKPTDPAKYWVSERSVGEFHRTFTFPGQIDHDGVSASLKDGVLTVRVPKAAPKDNRRRIEVTDN